MEEKKDLVNQKLAAGKYEYNLNASSLSSGILFQDWYQESLIRSRK